MFRQEGIGSLLLGFRPTMTGYMLQGATKFGLFELFKAQAAKVIGPERAAENAMAVYLASSASAETLASVLLCPFEALRIKKVGQPAFPTGIFPGLRTVVQSEGVGGYAQRCPTSALTSQTLPRTSSPPRKAAALHYCATHCLLLLH